MRRQGMFRSAPHLLGLAFLLLVFPLDSSCKESSLRGQNGRGALWKKLGHKHVGGSLGVLGVEEESPGNGLMSNFMKGFADLVDKVKNHAKAMKDRGTDAVKRLIKYAVVKSTDEEVCYKTLGCFKLTDPWFSTHRPIPKPDTPEEVDVHFYLYTRNQPERLIVDITDKSSLQSSDFDARRTTFFLVHGYFNSGDAVWMDDLKNAILEKVDGNFFIVDWGDGAGELNYLQAASNTRIVGRELGILGRKLVEDHSASAADFHFMGHSLGAHICGYAARFITGVGRITAFDPAGPGFEGQPRAVHLGRDAATFVDALHTNAKPLTSMGFGMQQAIAHVDLYMNGGVHQPGCRHPHVPPIKSLLDFVKIPANVIKDVISCSHARSYLYFTEAVKNTNCIMWGHILDAEKEVALWKTQTACPVPLITGKCGEHKCVPVGLNTHTYPARGAFSVVTNSGSPFCIQENSEDGSHIHKLQKSLGSSTGPRGSERLFLPSMISFADEKLRGRNTVSRPIVLPGGFKVL